MEIVWFCHKTFIYTLWQHIMFFNKFCVYWLLDINECATRSTNNCQHNCINTVQLYRQYVTDLVERWRILATDTPWDVLSNKDQTAIAAAVDRERDWWHYFSPWQGRWTEHCTEPNCAEASVEDVLHTFVVHKPQKQLCQQPQRRQEELLTVSSSTWRRPSLFEEDITNCADGYVFHKGKWVFEKWSYLWAYSWA